MKRDDETQEAFLVRLIREDTIAKAIVAIEAEAVEIDPDNHDPTDVSYNLALKHAVEALRALTT